MKKRNSKNLLIQPFLKWAGGKRQLIPQMEKYLKRINYTNYYEPFLGGGSILFYLQPTKAVVNDFNKDLIECYKCIKDNYDELIKKLGIEIYNSKNNEYVLNISGEEEAYNLFDLLAKNHIKVQKFEIMKPSLHDIFIEKVGEK